MAVFIGFELVLGGFLAHLVIGCMLSMHLPILFLTLHPGGSLD